MLASPRVSALSILASAIVFAACSGSGVTDPQAAFSAAPNATGTVSQAFSAPTTTSLPETEVVKACVARTEHHEQALRLEVVVVVGNDGTVDKGFHVEIMPGTCAKVWAHGGRKFDRVRIDLGVPAGASAAFVETKVTRTEAGNEVTASSQVNGNSVSDIMVRGRDGAVINFTVAG